MATKTRLKQYRAKRDLDRTPEPSGDEKPRAKSRARKKKEPRFVVQEHHASSLHWDFRLEHEGVLVSWAVPKGIPLHPKKNHLAIHVEDHPLDYIDFEGTIPKGTYGAGEVMIWDSGTYECEKFEDKKVTVVLHGERLHGRYALFHTRENQWMIHRMDPPLEEAGEPMPEQIVPMLAKLSKLPDDEDNWAFEIKWDGVRAVAYIEGGRVHLESRNLKTITPLYPELRELGRKFGSRTAILDGEIVALNEDGLPSFERIQQRLGLKQESAIRSRAKTFPVTYMIFDVLYLDGESTMELPYTERRKLLKSLKLNTKAWQTPAFHVGDGSGLLEAATKQRLEGIVAKRLDSVYTPGRRSGSWLKIKNQRRQELVIAGWTEGEGSRADRIGALLLGYYDQPRAHARENKQRQKLVFAGTVGTGFTSKLLDELADKLYPLEVDKSPFAVGSPGDVIPASKWKAMRSKAKAAAGIQTHFCKPKYVGEIEFTEWTQAGTLRHPSFKGLRYDKDPRDVVREDD